MMKLGSRGTSCLTVSASAAYFNIFQYQRLCHANEIPISPFMGFLLREVTLPLYSVLSKAKGTFNTN